MRGNFDNSAGWLHEMPASALSTEENAAKLSDALEQRTGVPWVVMLVPTGARRKGGGFYVAPTPDRLRDDKISQSDWRHLERLFEVLPLESCRWYLFPDEIAPAFDVLGVKLLEG